MLPLPLPLMQQPLPPEEVSDSEALLHPRLLPVLLRQTQLRHQQQTYSVLPLRQTQLRRQQQTYSVLPLRQTQLRHQH